MIQKFFLSLLLMLNSTSVLAEQKISLATGESLVLCANDTEDRQTGVMTSGLSRLNMVLLQSQVSTQAGVTEQVTLRIDRPFSVSAPAVLLVEKTSPSGNTLFNYCVTLTKK